MSTVPGQDSIHEFVKNIKWYHQAAVKIETGDKVISIDPYKLEKEEPADIVFITHPHGDHLDAEALSKVVTKNTIVVTPYNCSDKINTMIFKQHIEMKPGDVKEIEGLHVESVPAYNITKKDFHPKKSEWNGYIITVDGIKIYHTGDTERIPEMKLIETDIVLLPLGQTYTMNSVEDAANSALDVKAKIAIPIHYGLYEGTMEDAQKFSELLKGKVEVDLLQPLLK